MRLVACLGICLLLSGCSDFPDLFSMGGGDDDALVAAVAADTPAPPAAAAQANDSFCRNVAAGDAMGHGFDQATQARMAQQSYAQCQAIFAR